MFHLGGLTCRTEGSAGNLVPEGQVFGGRWDLWIAFFLNSLAQAFASPVLVGDQEPGTEISVDSLDPGAQASAVFLGH